MDETRRAFLKGAAAAATVIPGYAAGSDALRIGMIGAGGRAHEAAGQALTADKGARLVAIADIVMDRVKERRGQLLQKFPQQVDVPDDRCFTGFDAWKSVIEASDVVIIANAAKFHPMHTMGAIHAGKHVFVEKPHGIDPAGLKVVRQAAELAKQKNLSLLSGLQSRFSPMYRETIRRIHDGAIGDIVAIQETWLRPPYVLHARRPGMSELDYQGSNQYHFHWLSGDDVPQTLVHNLDRASWAMNGLHPIRCYGMGGRSTLQGEVYGNVFDHHSVVYEFATGTRMYALCRTIDNCYNENSSLLIGTKGRASVTQGWIKGETSWSFEGPRSYSAPEHNPYQIEHVELFKAIRSGKPINSGDYMVRSTMIGVMGQLSCYSGKELNWNQVIDSDFVLGPRPEDVRPGFEPPTRPGPGGIYPVAFTPGVSKLL